MTQPSPLQPDLREVRTTFLDKQVAYALSYGYELDHIGSSRPERTGEKHPSLGESLRLRLKAREQGEVFHVLGGDRVAGLDETGRDVPIAFKLRGLEEAVVLSGAGNAPTVSSARVEGRMVLEAPDGGDKTSREPVRISVTYDGVLRFERPVVLGDILAKNAAKETLRASAFVTPFFETIHPKYHWLVENVCIAYGTWELDGRGGVKASFDVYSVE
jgi:Protein of unknown function (DUF3237)